MKKTQKNLVIGVIAIVAIVVVAAMAVLWMGDDGEDESEPIQFGYVLWEGEIAATNVMALVLEEAGFEVDMVNVDAGIMYSHWPAATWTSACPPGCPPPRPTTGAFTERT